MISLIVLPNQLFPIKMLKALFKKLGQPLDKVILIEEPRYFTDFRFHKLKIMYHRATMQKYKHYLSSHKIKCIYKEFHEIDNSLYEHINKPTTYYFNPIDHKLYKKYSKLLSNAVQLDNPNFLLLPKEIVENKYIFYKNNKYYHDAFYKFQRKRLNILLDENKPVGGKW